MDFYHNTRDINYRRPFGAVRCGEKIELSLKAPQTDYAILRLFYSESGEDIVQPDSYDDFTFKWTITAPEDDTVFWYFFVIGKYDNVYCYGKDPNSTDGAGKVYYQGETPDSFQISVYHDFEVPDWYKEGIAYQIFPDRFCKAGIVGKTDRKMELWDTLPYYIKDEEGRITEWNFWGGNLQGITRMLGYIKNLGASVIYLNPIFEAQSNHRYDTSDYFKIDPLLGTEKDFTDLCKKADSLGIKIILDGVFSHTGSESKYFKEHPDWYKRDDEGNIKYWWGVKNLPELDEMNPEYSEMICGENGVVRHWIRLGASGWRLDVADELPNEFIKMIRAAAKEEKPDAVVLGEVWEDASYKIDYGERMRFLGGQELDSVMNYPLRDDIIAFTNGEIGASEFASRQLNRMENYPKEAFYSCFNVLGSHDRERILTIFEGSVEKLKFAAALQFVMPGIPVIYYGDEAGLEGGADPDNRRTFPVAGRNEDLSEYFSVLCSMRNASKCLKKGDFRAFEGENGQLVIERSFGDVTARFCFDPESLSWTI